MPKTSLMNNKKVKLAEEHQNLIMLVLPVCVVINSSSLSLIGNTNWAFS